MNTTDELIDLIGRLMFTHSIAPQHLRSVLGGDLAEAEAIVGGWWPPRCLDGSRIVRLELFASVLLRLEWRLLGDSRAMRDALVQPVEALGDATPSDLLAGGTDDLRALRSAIDMVAPPKTRWWRVGH